ncbi:hypothetical protein LXL04_031294 [Taraxacum kok-saghyz]
MVASSSSTYEIDVDLVLNFIVIISPTGEDIDDVAAAWAIRRNWFQGSSNTSITVRKDQQEEGNQPRRPHLLLPSHKPIRAISSCNAQNKVEMEKYSEEGDKLRRLLLSMSFPAMAVSIFVMGESSKGSMMEEGQHHPKNTDKRIKIEELMEKGGNDKISALPDCVLLEILSRLPSTKYAIRTEPVSPQLHNPLLFFFLSSSISTIHSFGPPFELSSVIIITRSSPPPIQATRLNRFSGSVALSSSPPHDRKISDSPPCSFIDSNNQCLENPNLDLDFVLSVSKTITQCRQLKKLKVDTFYHMQCEVQYNNWIRHAINCNVEELDLNFRSLGRELGLRKEFPSLEEDLWLDQSNFFINSCFTDLRLSCFTLNPSGAISWKNLRSLCISSQNLNEDLIVNILSGSPLLENLCLEYDYEMAVKSDVESDVESDEEFKAPYSSQWPQLEHLKKFEMSAVCHNLFASQVKSWIRYVIKCNVKNICISLWLDRGSEHELPIDEIIFTSSCVTDLRLDRCMINPVGAISWKNLTSLCISNCCLNDDMIENILSGSPVLETLVLDGCFGYTRLDITSNSVKNLVLSGRMGSYSNSEPKDAIEMNAPNILSLTIQNEMINKRTLLLVNVSSLVKANLNYEFRDIWFDHKTIPMEVEEMLKNHMMNIGHVKELKIGDLCYKFVIVKSSKGSMMEEGQNHPKNTDKRIKIEELMEKGGDDKISALPDCVLHEILSRLPSTKYAIRAGTLSKRWTHLWTWVPTLILKLSYDPYRSLENPNLISDFVLSVSKTITQCRQLKKFKVNTFYDMEFEVQYNNWIRHAINCNVEEVDLNFRSLGRELGFEKEFPSFKEDLWLDQSKFFINSCFTDLRLSGLALNPSGAISWKNLRSLSISSQNLNEDLIVNILSGSPLLENLLLKINIH